MQIVAFEAENVKALRAVSIKPDGALVEITGRNGQGRSTILDAIWWTLAGASHIQAVPIRNGETKARIRLDLGDIVVERKFTENNTKLTVENAEGAAYRSPQAMLDELLGALTFDPLAFAHEKPADQYETLRQTLGLDFSEVDTAIDEAFKARGVANANGKELRAAIGKMVIEGLVPAEPINTAALAQRIGDAANHNADIERRRINREAAQAQCSEKMQRASELMAEAERLKEEVRSTIANIKQAGELPEPINVDSLRDELATATERNEAFKANKLRSEMIEEAEGHEAKSAELTEKLTKLRQSKADMIEAADMPVEGLSFGEGLVMLNGVPFEQASTAQQLRASVGLAMAANPKLKVIRIKEG